MQEWQDMEETAQKNLGIREDSMKWRFKFESLKKFAIDNKIPIPPELDGE